MTFDPFNGFDPFGGGAAVGYLGSFPVTADLEAWWVADDIAGANNDPVSIWLSRTNGYIADQKTSSSRPVYKTNQLNGHASVLFDGTNDFLSFGGSPSFESYGGGTCTGLAYDATSNSLWIGNYTNGHVVNVTLTGALIADISTPLGASVLQGVTVDTSDNTLWVADYVTGLVHNISKSGAAIASFSVAAGIGGVAYDPSDDSLWVCRDNSTTISHYSCATLGLLGTITATISTADGIVVDPSDGNLLVSQDGSGFANSAVLRINKATGATISTYNGVSYYNNIEHIAVDSAGRWFLAVDDEFHNSIRNGNRIYRIDTPGQPRFLAKSSAGFSVVVVRKPSSNPTSFRLALSLSAGASGSTARIGVGAGASSGKATSSGRRLDADSAQTINSSTNVSTTLFQVHAAVWDWANSDLLQYVNGTADGANTSFQTAGSSSDTLAAIGSIGAFLGTSNYFGGDVVEVLLYNRALASAEIAALQTHFSGQYGI